MQILKTHMKEVHGDRSYTCNLCGLTLSCQRNLNTHMISHTTPSIPCDQCGKLFKRKYAVKNHIKKFHMQIKEKMCDQCDKSFADARHLREHVLAIHDKLKPFGCEVCDFKCARIDNLNTHRKKSHGLGNKLTRAEHDDWVLQVNQWQKIGITFTIPYQFTMSVAILIFFLNFNPLLRLPITHYFQSQTIFNCFLFCSYR